MSESVTGAINAIIPQGLKGDLQCHLVFTSQRIIVSVKGMLGQLAGGAFGAAGAAASYGLAQREDAKKKGQIDTLTPDQLLQTNKKNFEVPYAGITRIELGRKMGQTRLNIITTEKTFKFKIQGIKQEQVESLVRSYIPPTVQLQSVEKLSD